MPKIEMDKQYKTRDGRPVRILCVDYNSIHPSSSVIGLYKIDNNKESLCTWNAVGDYSGNRSTMDLIEVRPRIKLKYWVNVYKGNPEPWAGGLLFSKDNANSHAAQGRIACIPIEIDCEEGEGLDT